MENDHGLQGLDIVALRCDRARDLAARLVKEPSPPLAAVLVLLGLTLVFLAAAGWEVHRLSGI